MGGMKARRFLISGRVQGVGYRYFALRSARATGVTGWARNIERGQVEVHANGTESQLDDFEARLRMGPQSSDVRSVESSEVAVLELVDFHIR